MRLLLSPRTAFLYDLSSRSRDSHCALAPAITLPGTARGPPGPEVPFPARNPLVTYLLPARVATRSRGTHGKLGPRYATRSEPRSPLRTLQSRTTTPGTCHPCRLRLATCTSLHPRLPDMAQPTPARSAGPHPSPCTGRRVPHISPGYLPGLELPDVIVHASTNPAGSQIDRSLPRRIDPYWDPGWHRGDDLADPISPSMYAFIAPANFAVSSPSRQATTATALRPSPVHGHPTRRASTGGAGSPQTTPRCSPSGMKMGFESPERLHHRTT